MKKIHAVIIGGTGYGAGELLRLLLAHADVTVGCVAARSSTDEPICSVHSHLYGVSELCFSPIPSRDELIQLHDSAIACGALYSVVFLALPTGVSANTASTFLDNGLPSSIKIIDLSGDLRIADSTVHSAVYPEVPYLSSLRSQFRYSLPDLPQQAFSDASLPQCISNPGCLASAAILTLKPFTERTNPLVGRCVVDGKTGTSGAGREPSSTMHHPNRHADFTAYKPLVHRHEPEIQQALSPWNGSLMFVPHLIPVSRGIFVSTYGELAQEDTTEQALNHLRNYYKQSPFIRVRNAPPRLVDVVGTNFCDLSVQVRGKEVVIFAALDNLGKGMVGTAIQNMNLICGLPAHEGLMATALGPS